MSERSESNVGLTDQLGFKPVLDACCGSRMFWFDKQDDPVRDKPRRSGRGRIARTA